MLFKLLQIPIQKEVKVQMLFILKKKKKTCVAQECMNHQGNDELCRL